MSGSRAVVVGAGIGGLTAAIALARIGYDVTVLERARELTEAGAGIGVWPNALRALDEIGLAKAVEEASEPFSSTTIQDRDGRRLSSFDPARVVQRLGRQPVIAHRADVQRILLDAAADIPIRLGVPVARVLPGSGGRATVVTADGAEAQADLVVGADGVRSIVRRCIDSSEAQVSRLLSWRAVLDDAPRIDDAWLSIGSGQQFLATPLPGRRVYLAGLLGPCAGAEPMQELESLHRAYAGWHDPIPTLLDLLDEAGVRWDEVRHRRPPRSTVVGNVVVIGDAAHPMTPDLGQGGCQAIEDAVILAAALRRGGDDAIIRYDTTRRRRVRLVVNTSRQIGWALAARSPVISAVRNAVMPVLPQGLSLSRVARIASTEAFERNLATALS